MNIGTLQGSIANRGYIYLAAGQPQARAKGLFRNTIIEIGYAQDRTLFFSGRGKDTMAKRSMVTLFLVSIQGLVTLFKRKFATIVLSCPEEISQRNKTGCVCQAAGFSRYSEIAGFSSKASGGSARPGKQSGVQKRHAVYCDIQ
jgi:hypothetical protein